jgi:predicted secreted protein
MPIEVQSDDRGILSGTLSFIIYGNILNNVKDHQSSFYVKLPTMANLQTVRSFILTTLIAALLALLISSLGDKINYYKIEGERFLLSKFSKNGVKNSTVTQLKEWKQFQMVRNTLLLILTCFICYISYRSFIDEPFVMSAEEYSSLVTRLVLFTLLALAILSFMYYRYLKKK